MGREFIGGKGFTLIELLVAILIIMILAGYSIFAFKDSIEDASNAKAKATLELINSAIERFKIEYPNQGLPAGAFTNDYNVTTCVKTDDVRKRLIGCRYLQKIDFNSDKTEYNFFIGSGCGGDGYAYMTPKSTKGKYGGNYCAGINMQRGGKAIDGTI
jgi:prepilin-type N-terminal cleavage/methylation domain-containing protein